jgi:hypothetical protein
MPNRRFFRFSYYVPGKKDRTLRLHQLRDGDAFLHLAGLLYEKGYEYGGLILNHPAEARSKTRFVDKSFLTPSDLVVLTTRPPMEEEAGERDRKSLNSSNTSLERWLLDTMRRYFDVCMRSNVKLSAELARRLRDEFANRAWIAFKQTYDAVCKGYARHDNVKMTVPPPPPRTTFYFLLPPKGREDDPQVLCLFGMGGTETLLWTYLLSTKSKERFNLNYPRFMMAEMFPEPIPPLADNLSFADSWRVDFLVDLKL